jgi:hypothetical protein
MTKDLSKGSYYANPQYDHPVDDEALIAKYSPFIHPNIWPTDDLPELEAAFKELGQIIVNVGILVAKACDRYVHSKCSTYPSTKMQDIITNSLCCKGRLLHFFPKQEETAGAVTGEEEDEKGTNVDDFSSWCGWHNDHSSLTGLTPAMYMDENGNVVPNNDPTAGLTAAVSVFFSCSLFDRFVCQKS